ncbi:MAG TPA: hypothetical protein EYN66_04275, partial [Myxococcales bacterium]|nr:hypothetical protein [Myxococcales bacterium]
MSLLLALLTGILTLLCFPRFGWWPLVFVAQAPLMVALTGLRPGQRFVHGWLSGAVMTAGMQYWIANTLMDMSAFPAWMAGLGLLIYAAYSGLQWGVFALVYGALRRWSGHRGWLFTVPLSYILLEKLFPSLFPFTLANALFEVPVLLQVAEFTGASGPSLLIMMIACLFVQSYEDIVRKRYTEHLLMTAGAAIWLVAAVWGVVAMRGVWNAPIRGTPTIALIQPNVTIEEKKRSRSKAGAEIYERTAALTREALHLRPDLVIWPEGGFPFRFTRMSDPGFNPRNLNHRY